MSRDGLQWVIEHATQPLMLRRLLTALCFTPLLAAAGPEPGNHWLAERAATSDRVVLAQLDRIDYEYRRGQPVEGSAWFKPLITYKSDGESPAAVVVTEQGLKHNECYFPRVAPWEENPRYLLFLVEDREAGAITGHPDGCAIEILVDSAGGYAARWPQPALGGEHGRGDAALQARVREMTFQGPMARIDTGDLLAHQRRQRAERDFMEIDGTDLVPTRGIALTDLRRLMMVDLD